MWGGLAAMAGLAGAGSLIFLVPPGEWWVEAVVGGLVWVSLFVGGSWLIGRKKWSMVVSLGVMGLLIMNRWEILDVPMFGLWILVLGLVGLVN